MRREREGGKYSSHSCNSPKKKKNEKLRENESILKPGVGVPHR